MPSFRKKLVMIEAIQATGTPESNLEIIDWTRGSDTPASMEINAAGKLQLFIAAQEGAHWVSIGDYVIRDQKGDHYLCKEDAFLASYGPN